MRSYEAIKEKVKAIHQIAHQYGVVRIWIFGSLVSGIVTKSSDVDLLVEIDRRRDLLDLIGFQLDLEALLGYKVDVVTKRGLNPYLRTKILKEAKPLPRIKSFLKALLAKDKG